MVHGWRGWALAGAWVFMAVTLGCKQGNAETTPSAPSTAPLNSEEEKTLYALGLYTGKNLVQFNLKAEEWAVVQRGIADSRSGAPPLVEMQTYGPKLSELQRARAGERGKVEKEKGAAYLAKAAAEPGAQKLSSGVVYIEKQPGGGESPQTTDTVKVHYRGTLLDGKEFDSSYKRNQPATFPLRGVVKCWTEGLQKMKVGGKATLVCPSDTAYGDRGQPPDIAGGATLLFDVELLEIVKAQASPAPAGAPPH
jgi:FKBP-type peptidyl-prolyl cis-trans isomerase FkpA